MAGFGLVLQCGGIDGDAPGLLFRGLVDGPVLHVLRFLLLRQVFRDGRGQCGFPVINVSNRPH